MGASRTWIAVNALLAAMLACNVPAVQRPVQPPDLAGTITAQAMITALNTPGAHMPRLCSSTPPTEGAITRVKASNDPEIPRMPPISSRWTDLLMAL